MNSARVVNDLLSLSSEAKELYLPNEVPRLSTPPSPITFLRSYVMPNLPVVIENGVSHWPALKKWTDSYLKEVLGGKEVTVAVTPTGYADAVVNDTHFVLPDEKKMKFSKFLSFLEERRKHEVVYLQKQNNSFVEEFPELLLDAASEIPWASEAFGKSPDAINFWMGDDRSVTSMHKDHYENMYAVVQGSKTFILHPPTDLPCIPYKLFKVARYKKDQNDCYVIKEENNTDHCNDCLGIGKINLKTKTTVKKIDEASLDCEDESLCVCDCHAPASIPWICIDPLSPDLKKYPLYNRSNPVTVTVRSGDLLYLPSLWFHHVQQTGRTIAVNFWYDMEYDIRYNYFKFVENIKNEI